MSDMTFIQKRRMLKTGLDLRDCPFRLDDDGLITLGSFVRSDIVERVYRRSGKSFMYYLGCCNDARMEYELTSAEKCSILKHLFFNNKTSVPQLSRVLGLPRKLIQRIMST